LVGAFVRTREHGRCGAQGPFRLATKISVLLCDLCDLCDLCGSAVPRFRGSAVPRFLHIAGRSLNPVPFGTDRFGSERKPLSVSANMDGLAFAAVRQTGPVHPCAFHEYLAED
jgi:hypothetical protein